MQVNNNKEKESKSNKTGLSIIFSEKALIVLSHVILILGITHLHHQNAVKLEATVKVFQERQN